MHDQRRLLEGRLARFVTDTLHPHLYRTSEPLTVDGWAVPGEPVPFADARNAHYEPIAVGSAWGRPWSTLWLRLTGEVPARWRSGGRLPPGTRTEVVVDLGFGAAAGFSAEGLAYTPDGELIKGVAPRNSYVPIDPREPIDLYLEAAANPHIGANGFRPTLNGDRSTAVDEPLYTLRRLDVALRDDTVAALLADIGTLDGLMHTLPETQPRRAEILLALQRMVDAVDPDDVTGTATAGRESLREVLGRPALASAHHVVGVGHAHIDSAWLWPVRETIRKCARTFANVLALMDHHPDFRFACSSAQQYAWIKQHYPALFERIRKKVAEGQFLPVGGMWVESDTNLPGGEAMARQFVAGKRFFAENFGVETEEVWLPDSFGYSAALPQIVRASGSRWFLTQKISWNQTNRFPHSTFWWEGIDGTRVFTHFPPAETYASVLSGEELARSEAQYREHGRGTTSLLPFGHGDGGGGPTREMLDAAERLRSLEGSPTLRQDTPANFFAEAEAEYPDAPVWRGELYLELHRGTYTTQARTKQGNRRSEHLLREAELWAATAAVRTGADYPYDELEQLWQLVLLQQFHDILPGSSIAWVYVDAERNYAAIARRAEAVIAEAARDLVGDGSRRLLLNAAPHPRAGVPALGIGEPETPADPVRIERPLPEPVEGRREGPLREARTVLDNGRVRVEVDERGLIASLVDARTGREAIATGSAGNVLQLHRDQPNQWDAWDVDEFYRRTVQTLDDVDSLDVEEDAAGATVVVRRSFGSSTIEQRIRLAAGEDAVEIVHDVDWQERQKLLKLGFGFDVHADSSAAETQFGHVFRPTHVNTSWEFARFEICAHRWLHVGEPGYGVAVCNDATYGWDVTRDTRPDGGTTTTVRASLLRAPEFPDPLADQGRHTVRIVVRPGAGIAEAVEEGYRTNLPPRVVSGAHGVQPLVTVSDPAVVVESVKLAEDRSGDVVVRLYESLGGRAFATVTVDGARSLRRTDLLERPLDGADAVDSDRIDLVLRPFELVTLRAVRGD